MGAFDEFFDRHQNVVLQFSSGKDSAACLWLLEEYWPRITVLWCNPGNPYPETLDYMDRIWTLVPDFIEVHGNQPAWIKEYGYPVDILPISASPFIPNVQSREVPRLQPFTACCYANLWEPIMKFMVEDGVTGVIRGQKLSDRMKSPIRSGDVVQGFEFLFPIENWTDEDVVKFLGPERMPPSYARGLKSSLDCINCTAYMAENTQRINDLDGIDAAAAAEVRSVHAFLKEEMLIQLKLLEN